MKFSLIGLVRQIIQLLAAELNIFWLNFDVNIRVFCIFCVY
jgi:hypothetical protein